MNTTIAFLEYLSPTFGFIGTVLIFLYGVPRQIDTGGVVTLSVSDVPDEEEKAKIKKFKFWGNVGLILIGLSFLASIASLIIKG